MAGGVSEVHAVRVLDGPIGTELDRRGVPTPLPRWSANAIEEAPAVLGAIHRDYARAGATVHTANTFRTKRRNVGSDWERLARRAVEIARAQIPREHKLAGSIAPLEDCYRPDLSPGTGSRAEHRELARVLADAGCDVLLCETFPHVREALVAVEEAVSTGLETWMSLTAGPDCDLLTVAEVERGAKEAVARGARAVLMNCVPADRTLEYLHAIAAAGAPFGAYANAGRPDERMGWIAIDEEPIGAADRYLAHARAWVAAGASIVGSCCGTGPSHIAALARAFSGI